MLVSSWNHWKLFSLCFWILPNWFEKLRKCTVCYYSYPENLFIFLYNQHYIVSKPKFNNIRHYNYFRGIIIPIKFCWHLINHLFNAQTVLNLCLIFTISSIFAGCARNDWSYIFNWTSFLTILWVHVVWQEMHVPL